MLALACDTSGGCGKGDMDGFINSCLLGSRVGRPRRCGCTVGSNDGCMVGVGSVGEVGEVKSNKLADCGAGLVDPCGGILNLGRDGAGLQFGQQIRCIAGSTHIINLWFRSAHLVSDPQDLEHTWPTLRLLDEHGG